MSELFDLSIMDSLIYVAKYGNINRSDFAAIKTLLLTCNELIIYLPLERTFIRNRFTLFIPECECATQYALPLKGIIHSGRNYCGIQPLKGIMHSGRNYYGIQPIRLFDTNNLRQNEINSEDSEDWEYDME